MKKAFIFMALFTMIFVFGTAVTFAGGGQNTITHCGDNGEGTVVQNQVQVNNE